MQPRSLAPFALGLSLLCSAVPAQLPDGWLLAGCYRWSGSQPCTIAGPGGLHAIDPRSGAATPITGLPPEILGNVAASTLLHGVDFALRVPDTNRIVANAWGDGTVGQQMPLFVLGLSGSQVIFTQRHDIGILGAGAFSGAGLPQAEALENGRVLLGVDPLTFQTGQALANTMLAVLNTNLGPGPGAVLPIPIAPLPSGNTNAIAHDRARGVVWLGVFQGTQSTIYHVPFPQGGAPTTLTTLPNELITGLALQHDGTLLATSYDVTTNGAGLYHVDPAGPTTTAFPQVANLFNAETVRVEPATGDILLVAGATCGTRDVYRIRPAHPATGVLTPVAIPPLGGWGTVSSLDINPDPEVYGQPSGSPLEVTWQVAPSARGLPRLGNSMFALELTAAVPPVLAGCALGLSRASSAVIPGLQILVDPLAIVVLVPGTSMMVPLAIPNYTGLIGLPVFAQGAFFDSNLQLGATAGVHVTILP